MERVAVGIVLFSVLVFIFWVRVDPDNPTSVVAAINQRGAKWLMADSRGDSKTWYRIMDNIASGEDAWIKVFEAFAPTMDGHPAEDLTAAASKALLKNPEPVARVLAQPENQKIVPLVCGRIDDHRPFDPADKTEFLKLQRERVAAVLPEELQPIKVKCLRYIDEALAKRT